MQAEGIMRICVCASDINNSIDFFTHEMELTVVERGVLDSEAVNALYGLHSEARYAMLSNRDQPTLLELLEFDVPGSSIRIGRPSWDYGYYDVAFRAKDNAAEHEHFTAMGLNYYCPPTRYVADWINLDVLEAVLCGPDSMPMALIERLKEPIPKFDGRFSIFTDVAQTVENGEEADRFYADVLGLKKVFDETLPDGLVDAIVSVPPGTHTRMLMYSGGDTPISECLEYSLKGRSMSDSARPGNYGIFCTAYERQDLDAVLEDARRAGFEVIRGIYEYELKPYGKIRSAFISGPSGMLVEVYTKLGD